MEATETKRRIPRKRVRRTPESYRQEVAELTGGEYTLLGDYVNMLTPVIHRHKICGYEWCATPSHFVKGSRCPKCAGCARKTTDLYRESVSKIAPDYTVVDDYINARTPIVHRHNPCGHEWRIRPNGFLNGKRCPSCAASANGDRLRKSHEDYCEELKSVVGEEYVVLGRYTKNLLTPILHLHNIDKCGHKWFCRPGSILSGSRCPRCNESKGEKRVAELLVERNVLYEREYRFPDCRHKNPLPFDFVVYGNSNKIAIEYDGQQHFESIKGLGGLSRLKYTQRNDRIKTEYCAANGIPLIRIPYTQFDEIETILTHELTKLGVIGKRQSRRKRTRKESEVTA